MALPAPPAHSDHAGTAGGSRSVPAASVLGLIALVLLLPGCSRSPSSIPESPPEAVEAVVAGLGDSQPQVLWHALPPSYQADIRELIATFCRHMDADLYDRAFRVLGQGVRVLREKEDYIFNSPLALSMPLLESSMGSQWDETVGLLNTFAKSDLSSLESLRRMDPGDFLASTGHTLMAGLDDLRVRSQRSPMPNPWERMSAALKDARIEFVKTGADQGSLRFTSTTNSALRDVELTQVEGRWIPRELAGSWSNRVAEAKTRLAGLSGPEFQKAKPVLSLALGTLETAMDSLLQAGSQKEFDDTLRGLTAIGGMLGALKGTP